jgi:hypothetical protein
LQGVSNEEVIDDVVAVVAMLGLIDDEAINLVIFDRLECRDIEISCIAARSLAEPPEACRPQEGLKTKSAQAPGDTWQGR